MYISLYRIKEILMDNNYYCSCFNVRDIDEVKGECLTLIGNGESIMHYIIIKRIDCKYVYFYDPLFIGIRRWKKHKFVSKWSNICLFYIKV